MSKFALTPLDVTRRARTAQAGRPRSDAQTLGQLTRARPREVSGFPIEGDDLHQWTGGLYRKLATEIEGLESVRQKRPDIHQAVPSIVTIGIKMTGAGEID